MIKLTANKDGKLFVHVEVRGYIIYLDNWAIYDLAEEDPARRDRFINVVRSGAADLMFSVTNAIELAGPQGHSFDTVKSFLNEIGPYWFPVDLNIFEVMEREKRSPDPAECCVSEEFALAYLKNYETTRPMGPQKIIDPTDSFCHLGAVLDWMAVERLAHLDRAKLIGEEWRTLIDEARKKPGSKSLQFVLFEKRHPATSTLTNLSRILLAEDEPFEHNDAFDLCHAVMGCAFASFTTLDTTWKRRVEQLPKPNGLARVYGPNQLDQMVTDIESCVDASRPESWANGTRVLG